MRDYKVLPTSALLELFVLNCNTPRDYHSVRRGPRQTLITVDEVPPRTLALDAPRQALCTLSSPTLVLALATSGDAVDEAILRKIKSCLALSGSSNEHEAAVALKQAQALMRKYGLTEQDVDAAEITQGSVESKTSCRAVPEWEVELSRLIAGAFGCHCVFLLGTFVEHDRSRNVMASVKFIGTAGAVAMSSYAFEVLSRQILKARASFVTEFKKERPLASRKRITDQGNSFALGFVWNLSTLVNMVANSERTEAAIVARKNSLYPALRKLETRSTDLLDEALAAGMEASKDAQLFRAAGFQPRTLLGEAK